jgi:hypothetical protein
MSHKNLKCLKRETGILVIRKIATKHLGFTNAFLNRMKKQLGQILWAQGGPMDLPKTLGLAG